MYGQPDAHDSAARSAGDFLNLKTVLTCTANVGNAHLGNVREVSSSFEFETETLDDLLESSTGEQIMCTLLSPHMHLLQRHHSCLLAVSFC